MVAAFSDEAQYSLPSTSNATHDCPCQELN